MKQQNATHSGFRFRKWLTSAISLVREVMTKSKEDETKIQAAALSYFAVFSIFPLLILLGSCLGMMNLNIQSIAEDLKTLVPNDVLTMLVDYLNYTNQTVSPAFLTFSIVFSVYFPFRAVRLMMHNIRKAYDLPRRKSLLSSLIRELGCTLLVPASLFVCLVLILLGQNVVMKLNELLFNDLVPISEAVMKTWQSLRFVLAGGVLTLALTVLYEASLDRMVSIRKILPGIALVIVFWVIASAAFSFYVENFANYSVIYGTLGGFVILLLWLYFTSSILITGAQFNAALFRKRKQ